MEVGTTLSANNAETLRYVYTTEILQSGVSLGGVNL